MSPHPLLVRPGSVKFGRAACVLLAAALLAIFSPSPAFAGGTAYNMYNWAGVRAWGWKDNLGMWPAPTQVTAQWQIPCLSTTDNRFGAYDQWIGIEGSQGTLIQVGVRSYHVNTGFGVVTGYFAWVVDTRDPAVSTPQRVFTIVRCGLGTSSTTPYPIVTAEVNADGRVRIEASDTGNTWEATSYRHWWTGIGYPESARYGSFILERFTSSVSNTMPWFGTAGFRWCRAGSSTGGWLLGDQNYVRSARTDMVSHLPHPPWTSAWSAVLTGDWLRDADGAVHGDFNFAQFLTY